MGLRRKSREIALQYLFQTEFQTTPPSLADITASLREFHASLLDSEDAPLYADYAGELIGGVLTHQREIDNTISQGSAHWKLERMSYVDRNIMRVAVYEMLLSPNPLAANIAINEAVEISRRYGSTDSSAFVNGVLDQIAHTHDAQIRTKESLDLKVPK